MIGNSLEAEQEHKTEKKVIMSINCQFVLVLAEMKEGVRGSRVVVKGQHYVLL